MVEGRSVCRFRCRSRRDSLHQHRQSNSADRSGAAQQMELVGNSREEPWESAARHIYCTRNRASWEEWYEKALDATCYAYSLDTRASCFPPLLLWGIFWVKISSLSSGLQLSKVLQAFPLLLFFLALLRNNSPLATLGRSARQNGRVDLVLDEAQIRHHAIDVHVCPWRAASSLDWSVRESSIRIWTHHCAKFQDRGFGMSADCVHGLGRFMLRSKRKA
jgi:hypothetical protein